MSEKTTVQRQYRDRLFKFIFGNPENKEWTLSLYNAINGSNHTDPNAIRLKTIEDILYMGMKNDVSFLINDVFSFYEHQSTINLNLPLRFFLYAGMAYQRYVEENDTFLYSIKRQTIPTPKCVCFYNGATETEERTILRLSDAFGGGVEPDIDVRVTMININYGHNKELLDACKPLKEYAWISERIRAARKTYAQDINSLEKAIDTALKEMPDDFVIKPFLLANQAEVKAMFLTEYNQEKTMQLLAEEYKEEGRVEGRAEGHAEGRVEGRVEGILETLARFVDNGVITLEQAAQDLRLTVPEFEAKVKELEKDRAEFRASDESREA